MNGEKKCRPNDKLKLFRNKRRFSPLITHARVQST